MNTGDAAGASTRGPAHHGGLGIGGKTTYALEGSSFIAGAAVQWLRDGLGLIKQRRRRGARSPRSVKETGDVVFVPALAGLGAPHWRPEARGLFAGIDRCTTAAHLARAALEGIACRSTTSPRRCARDGRPATFPPSRWTAAPRPNDLLMQFQADMLGVPVVRPRLIETTAWARRSWPAWRRGVEGREEIRRAWKVGKRFEPKMKPVEREAHLAKWRRAVERLAGLQRPAAGFQHPAEAQFAKQSVPGRFLPASARSRRPVTVQKPAIRTARTPPPARAGGAARAGSGWRSRARPRRARSARRRPAGRGWRC